MQKSRVTNWDANKLRGKLLAYYIAVQNKRLIDYAKGKIGEIGRAIEQFHSKNHMDRTGNLLNSLCWGVSYNGRLVEGGFYRDETLHDKGILKTSESFIHEWFSGDEKYLEEVHGRQLAEKYLQTYGNNGARGWRVFFAILAPYWGYWEKGFTMNSKFGAGKSGVSGFYQFAVMTQFYDSIKQDLKPARTRIRVSVRQYSHAKIKEKWNKQEGF